jgi:hypothetical protein
MTGWRAHGRRTGPGSSWSRLAWHCQKQHNKDSPGNMNSLKEKPVTHLGYVGFTTIIFLGFNWINELFFIRFEQSNGINWVFLPAGIRLLATLLFGFAGFAGLLLAGIYLNFHHFVFDAGFRAWSGAIAGAGGPYLAYLFAKALV